MSETRMDDLTVDLWNSLVTRSDELRKRLIEMSPYDPSYDELFRVLIDIDGALRRLRARTYDRN